jgi:hypothetical protein
MEEKELFQEYELKGWDLTPRFYKIIAAAFAMHLFAFAVIGQVNLFGTKACDSPYIGKVCQVLDTAYMASVLLGTNTEFSSRDYDKTEIENIEDYEVTFIDVSDKLVYPEGYFALANPTPPETFDPSTISTDGSIPGIPNGLSSSPSTLDPNAPAVLPTPNPNAVIGELPTSPLGNNPIATSPRTPRIKSPRIRTPRAAVLSNESPSKLPSDEELANKDKKNSNSNSNTTAQTDKQQADGVSEEEKKLFNKKPLEDFGAKYGEAILNKEVDINAPFEIEIKGGLDEFGKLVKPTMTVKEGSDPKMTEVAKEAIAAFSDSQLLRTLYEAGVRNVSIKFAQNQDNLMAIIQSDAGTPNKAGSIQSSVNIAKTLALKTMNPDSDEAKLISKAETATNGKFFILNFLIPNEEKASMIEKNLQKLQEKLKEKQPNSGVAETKGKMLTSAK